MPRRPAVPAPDPGGPVHLRPVGALVLCGLVAAMVLGLSFDAVLAAGPAGLLLLPAPLFVLAGVWALLWAPRVVVHEDRLEVRNILRTHHVPFGAVRRVRLGSMLRLDVVAADGAERTVTAWNAPGLPRDTPWRRQDTGHGPAPRGARETRAARPTPEQRLVRDQSTSRSALVTRRIAAWEAKAADPGVPGDTARATTSVNTGVLAVLGTATVLLVLRIVL